MQSRRSAVRKNGGPRRRKVALACESCRTRKARCDGEKPICGPCRGRGLSLDRCLYKTADNARSASNDEYLRLLHRRIRELETTCINAGVAVPDFGAEELPDDSMVTENEPIDEPSQAVDHNAGSISVQQQVHGTDQVADTTPARQQTVDNPTQLYCSPRTETDLYPATPFELESNVTGMGAISSVGEGEKAVNEYYGSSSTASLMRFLSRDGMRRRDSAAQRPSTLHDRSGRREGLSSLFHECSAPINRFGMDEVLLPPRDLADHLLDCFWDRVYCLYPFFDRESFQNAYENLWISRSQPSKPLSDLDIGLGNKANSGNGSIVFKCALNMIFALGCHFADMPVIEREPAAHTFFLRAKKFIGLDILDIRTVGTVQAFLLTVLFLQSTPYPHRCWHSVGVACRVAQGLGLHESQLDKCRHPLEREIQRRTWHGCVMMDMFVSMTYGRPTVTSHLSSVPLPESSLTGSMEQRPSIMSFYISTIELYKILDTILSDVYKAWRGRGSTTPTGSTTRHAGLDVIMELEEKLLDYEAHVPSFLNWTSPATPMGESPDRMILKRQRNVLHARFLYLHLLLYRPIFTQVCSDTPSRTQDADHRSTTHSTIYSSILTKCATACVRAATNLVSAVYDTYQTTATDTWWYNGFYTSTAGMVLIMSYTCDPIPDPIPDELDPRTIETAWTKCEHILQQMGTFSLSARNTLQFLQAARAQFLANRPEPPAQPAGRVCSTATGGHQRQHITQPNPHPAAHGLAAEPLPGDMSDSMAGIPNNQFPWDPSLGAVASDLGFLGPFDFNDLHGWLPDGGLGA